MTDKELDKILNTALNSDEVPPELNRALLEKAGKRQANKARIYSFVKTVSACAAVFVCAVAVVSYFNKGIMPPENITDSKIAAKDTVYENSHSEKGAEDISPKKESEDSLPPALSKNAVAEAKSVNEDMSVFEREMTDSSEEALPEEITRETALSLAEAECSIVYDKKEVTYDTQRKVWRVDFYKNGTESILQSVYVDMYGNVLSAE